MRIDWQRGDKDNTTYLGRLDLLLRGLSNSGNGSNGLSSGRLLQMNNCKLGLQRGGPSRRTAGLTSSV